MTTRRAMARTAPARRIAACRLQIADCNHTSATAGFGIFRELQTIDGRAFKSAICNLKSAIAGRDLRRRRRAGSSAGAFFLELGLNVVDRLPDGLDLLGFLVRNGDLEFFFQLHDQFDDVEGIGADVFLERGVARDLFLVHAQVVADDLNDAFFSGCHNRFLPKRLGNTRRTQASTEPTWFAAAPAAAKACCCKGLCTTQTIGEARAIAGRSPSCASRTRSVRKRNNMEKTAKREEAILLSAKLFHIDVS